MVLTVTLSISLPTLQQTSFAKDLLCVSVIISNTLLYDIILLINCDSILAKDFGYCKNPLDLILPPSKGGMQCVCTHDQVTIRTQKSKM